MSRLHTKSLLPALIFAFCILEMSFGTILGFRVVWWFYLFFVVSFFDLFKKGLPHGYIYINYNLIGLYLINCLLFLIHHLLSSKFYVHSSSESFNILWWTLFGFILLNQIKIGLVNYELFWNYLSGIVWVGSLIASVIGLYKYYNIISGNFYDTYYHEGNLLLGSSLNSDYNIFSLGLLIGVIFSFGFQQKIKVVFFKLIYWFSLLVIFISASLSGSRRALLLVFLTILFLFLFSRIQRLRSLRQIIRYSYIPVIGFLIIYLFGLDILDILEKSEYIDTSISRIFTLQDELSGDNERTIRFEWVIDKFWNSDFFSMFFGQGFEYLGEMGGAFSLGKEDNPHNFVLSALLYGGLLGAILIIYLTLGLLKYSFESKKEFFFISILLILFGLTSSNSLFALRIFPTILILSVIKVYSPKRDVHIQIVESNHSAILYK